MGVVLLEAEFCTFASGQRAFGFRSLPKTEWEEESRGEAGAGAAAATALAPVGHKMALFSFPTRLCWVQGPGHSSGPSLLLPRKLWEEGGERRPLPGARSLEAPLRSMLGPPGFSEPAQELLVWSSEAWHCCMHRLCFLSGKGGSSARSRAHCARGVSPRPRPLSSDPCAPASCLVPLRAVWVKG